MVEETTSETVAVAHHGDEVSNEKEANGRPADGEAVPDLDALEVQFKTVRAAGRGLQEHEASAERSVDAVLDLLFPIGRALMNDPARAERFIRRIATPRTAKDGKTVRRTYKAAARKNVFLPLVKEAFESARKAWHSKYAAALSVAAVSDLGTKTPSAFIRGFKFTKGAGDAAKELTGIEACVAYRAELDRDGKGQEPKLDANRDALLVLGSGIAGAPCVATIPLPDVAAGSGFGLGLLYRGSGFLRLVADLACDVATLRRYAEAVLADDTVGTFLPASPYRPLIQGIAVLATLLPDRLPAHADPARDHGRMVQFRQDDGRGGCGWSGATTRPSARMTPSTCRRSRA